MMNEKMIKAVVVQLNGGAATLKCGAGILGEHTRQALEEIEKRAGELVIETRITITRRHSLREDHMEILGRR